MNSDARTPRRLHQPPNPKPDVTVPSHPRVQAFKQVAWREAGRWRVGQVGRADRAKAAIHPFDGDRHIRVFLGDEIDELRVKPPEAPSHHPRS